MSVSADRRIASGPRISLEALVEVAPEGGDEFFEADGVNLGLGGLSMRATYLPDVGSRMRCRFPCPPLGGVVDAEAEVVWCDNTGPYTGEFGLRFVGLDHGSEDALRRMVLGAAGYVPPAPEGLVSSAGLGSDVLISIDGVMSPIRAGVVGEDEELLSLSQPLPFLRLQSGVTVHADGRRGRIESVDLVVKDDVPRLLIDVFFDDAPMSASVGGIAGEESFTDTAVDVEAPTLSASEAAIVEELRETLRGEPSPETLERSAYDDEPMSEEPVDMLRVVPVLATSVDEDEDEDFVEQEESPRALVAPVKEPVARSREIGESRRDASVTLVRRLAVAQVALGAFFGRARSYASEELRPALGKLFARVRATLQGLLGTLRSRAASSGGLVSRTKRRKTTAPPTKKAKVAAKRPQQARAEARPEPRSNRHVRRLAAVAILGAAALGLVAFAFSSPDEPAPLPALETPPAPVVAAPIEVEPAVVETEPAEVPLAAPVEAPVAPSVVVPEMPTAMDAPSRQAGPMPAPTFPSLREGAQPSAPNVLPEGSPYGADVRPEAQVAPEAAPALFGAASISDGRTYLIRMSQPVRAVRGTARTDGFSVTVPESLSLDRAGPIASSHPLVERAVILNRGDHAELTITFVAGKSPAYQVRPRGSAIEVVIARQ